MQLQFLSYPNNFLHSCSSLSVLLNEWGPKKFSPRGPVMHPADWFPTSGFGLDHCGQHIHRQAAGTFPAEFTPESVPERQHGGVALGLAPPAWHSFPELSQQLCTITSPSRTCYTAPVGCSAGFMLFQQFKLKKYMEGVMIMSQICRGTTCLRREPGAVWMIQRAERSISFPSAFLPVKSESAAVFL